MTWVPSRRENASVSASHSAGNSAATWLTGQWCWQSWTAGPPGPSTSQQPGALLGAGGVEGSGVLALEVGDPAAGERVDGVVAGGVGEVAQRLNREVVVLLLEGVAAGGGEGEDLGGATGASGTVDGVGAVRRALPRLGEAVLDEGVEVAADGGGRQVEPLGERGHGLRPALEQRPGHPRRGAREPSGRFHNPIVA